MSMIKYLMKKKKGNNRLNQQGKQWEKDRGWEEMSCGSGTRILKKKGEH